MGYGHHCFRHFNTCCHLGKHENGAIGKRARTGTEETRRGAEN